MTFPLFAALAPLAVLVGALTLLNHTTVRAAAYALLTLGLLTLWPEAGTVGEASTALQAGTVLQASALSGPAWLRALPDALLLAATVAYTLFFGLLLHHLLEATGALARLLSGVQALGRDPLEQLLWVLLVFGPLFESISGFGLAVMIAVPMLLALGYSARQAMALSLLTQLAVPWGALAIGMGLGAAMAGLSWPQVGAATAVLAAPVYVLFWAMALRLARPAGAWSAGGLGRSAAALLVFALGVWGCNRWLSPELGGVAGAALLAGWLLATGGGARTASPLAGAAHTSGPAAQAPQAHPMGLARAALPHIALVAVLLATRFHGPTREWLSATAVLRWPGAYSSGNFALPLLYNPGASLALACAVAALGLRGAPGSRKGALLSATLRRWWPAAGAVLLLVLLARVMSEGGLIGAMADAITGGAGGAGGTGGGAGSGADAAGVRAWRGVVFPPLIAGLGGFFTGSVAGANALFVNLQSTLATGVGLPVLWVVALQTMIAAGCTALSPARMVFAATMSGLSGEEGAVLRQLWPLAAGLLLLGMLALSPSVLGLLQAASPLLVGE